MQYRFLAVFLLLGVNKAIFCLAEKCQQPNIIFIIADDLGWNDLGFHGSGQIPTPNIDALAYSGLILNNYYVNPICTPSRSALMTGKYPIHTGMQHTVLFGMEARGLPLSEKILPEYLKELGYVNHIVGKWHLGSYQKEFTPLYRGFESHLGIWTGHHDYFDHIAAEKGTWGLDMRRNMNVAFDLHGQYSTDVFTQESVKIINEHNTSKPLFLYLAHVATHSGNPDEPLRAPDEAIKRFSYIDDYQRRKFGAILSKMDDSVGKVVATLNSKGMLENSIIIFTTDNGGAAAGFNLNAASNFPLRGVKNTLWEGGIRGAALLWSPLIKKPKRTSTQMMHIVDWLPTLLFAAGNRSVNNLEDIDGINLWSELSEDLQSPRTEILHNIDDQYSNAAITLGDYKLLVGTTYGGQWDGWYGPSGRNYSYDIPSIQQSEVGKILTSLNRSATPDEILRSRNAATVQCNKSTSTSQDSDCKPLLQPCLFNITEDPCELHNIANEFPDAVQRLRNRLDFFNSTAIPPGNLPMDQRGNPKYWNYVWTNFGDYDGSPSVEVI